MSFASLDLSEDTSTLKRGVPGGNVHREKTEAKFRFVWMGADLGG